MEAELKTVALIGGRGSAYTCETQQKVSGSSNAIFRLPQVLKQLYSTFPPSSHLEDVKLGLKSKAEVSEVIWLYQPLIS